MQHADPDLLSLIALGEPVPPYLREHLATCLVCQGEVESLRQVVDAVRVPLPDLAELVATPPPARVWAAIAARTGAATAPAGSFAYPDTQYAGDLYADAQLPEGPARPGPAPVVNLSERRDRSPRRAGRRSPLIALIAAASLLIGVAIGAAGTIRFGRDASDPATGSVLRTTALAELPGTSGASGQAQVVRSGDGRRLTVDVTGLQRPTGFYEVWLIDRKLNRMYPVGALDGDRATFTLPPGVDVDQFPIVDVSVEPLDGNPSHSGKSVLRGTI